VEARINREWGRELTVTASDRGHAMIGIFFFNYNLYHLRANLAPGGADGNADAVRSQQSLRVIGGRNGGGNRPGGRPGRGFGRRGAFVLRAFS
jgi:hypothetical protein